MRELRIRPVTPQDAERLVEIYAPYVTDTAITFEYEIPSIEEFKARIENTLRRYPYIAAVQDEIIVGYAYVGAFVGRAAYDWSVETSIYVDRNCRKSGIGGALYHALEQILREMHILNLNACIGVPEVKDEHLDRNSVEFHRHLGYSMVGEFHRCGYKFGTWYNMAWMEKMIGEHPAVPERVLSFDEVRGVISEKYGIG